MDEILLSTEDRKPKTFRSTSGFGKRIEYWIIGRMLKEGMDVYVPLVDDHAVDAIIRRNDGTIALIQIKARSRQVVDKDAALFAAILHDPRPQSPGAPSFPLFLRKRWDSTPYPFPCFGPRDKRQGTT